MDYLYEFLKAQKREEEWKQTWKTTNSSLHLVVFLFSRQRHHPPECEL
jgi:hypothetical protein